MVLVYFASQVDLTSLVLGTEEWGDEPGWFYPS